MTAPRAWRRREFLGTLAAAGSLPLLARCGGGPPPPPRWGRDAYRKPVRSRVAVLRAETYDAPLADLLRRGLRLCGVEARGRRVVLKPNLVEHDPAGAVNTHPAVVGAAVEAFRALGAREVVVAEGPGHRRDIEHLLTASGLLEVLRDARVPYVDLNHDAVRAVPLRTRCTALGRLYLPETVLGAELVVSLAKLKTHHWAGVTLSLKNLFGVVPGGVYGWPKNVLHWAGIAGSILDLNATLAAPRVSIVDGIVGMEGDGPIRGRPRASGLLVLGQDPVAVDATAARLMGIEPARVDYLREADAFLGNLAEERIEQVGELPGPLRQEYALPPRFAHLRAG
mgnify:CR=1 FL=1